MKLIIEAEIGDIYATPEELADMTDEQVIELINEDVSEFLEHAEWKVVR